MALDQIYEQNNKIIKGAVGATSLLNTQDESDLIRRDTCVPEVTRIVLECEYSLYKQDVSSSSAKHSNRKIQTKIQQGCCICLSSNSM